MAHTFHSLLSQLKRFLLQQHGQDLVEYALVAAMVSLGAVAGMQTFAVDISNSFSYVATTFNADI